MTIPCPVAPLSVKWGSLPRPTVRADPVPRMACWSLRRTLLMSKERFTGSAGIFAISRAPIARRALLVLRGVPARRFVWRCGRAFAAKAGAAQKIPARSSGSSATVGLATGERSISSASGLQPSEVSGAARGVGAVGSVTVCGAARVTTAFRAVGFGPGRVALRAAQARARRAKGAKDLEELSRAAGADKRQVVFFSKLPGLGLVAVARCTGARKAAPAARAKQRLSPSKDRPLDRAIWPSAACLLASGGSNRTSPRST
mmetsp:Transcript_67017/g.158058  ORF Transcript_67017/g.158058 Transcript_67017/m.158058 type:complete len:259 (+) Transcript_67017:370-1146(+)